MWDTATGLLLPSTDCQEYFGLDGPTKTLDYRVSAPDVLLVLDKTVISSGCFHICLLTLSSPHLFHWCLPLIPCANLPLPSLSPLLFMSPVGRLYFS